MDEFEHGSILCCPSWCKKHRVEAMSAEERTGPVQKGPQHRIRAMSAKERTGPVRKGPQSRITWTAELDGAITRMITDRNSYHKIAPELGNGLTGNGVNNRWTQYLKKSTEIIKPRVPPGQPSSITWNAEVDGAIRRMIVDCFSYDKIALELGNGLKGNDVNYSVHGGNKSSITWTAEVDDAITRMKAYGFSYTKIWPKRERNISNSGPATYSI